MLHDREEPQVAARAPELPVGRAPAPGPAGSAAAVLALQRSAGNAAVARMLARQPVPPPWEEGLPPSTGPQGGKPPPVPGCSLVYKEGKWYWKCHDLEPLPDTPDIPLDPRDWPGELDKLKPKPPPSKPPPAWPLPGPKPGQPPDWLEGICRRNPFFPGCAPPIPAPHKPAPTPDAKPIGSFYDFSVAFERNQPAGQTGGMTADGAKTLEFVVEHLQADPTLQVRLVGHASSEGTPDVNLELSKRRARAVLAQLAGRGLDTRVMDLVGGPTPDDCTKLEFGVWACGAAKAAPGGRPEDRRVTVTFLRNKPVQLPLPPLGP